MDAESGMHLFRKLTVPHSLCNVIKGAMLVVKSLPLSSSIITDYHGSLARSTCISFDQSIETSIETRAAIRDIIISIHSKVMVASFRISQYSHKMRIGFLVVSACSLVSSANHLEVIAR